MSDRSYKTDSKGEDPTQCMFCKIPLSLKHILLDCPAFNVCRKLSYEVNSLKEFSIILPENVLEFYHILMRDARFV